ncbi:PepSY-associated TM helix domain-containing protein [Amycolatopsis nigrescens]|uniref:PepSY-associated TM helix domain-containing protein n=1 Tax=Amycolatopsis nigrescens TaxID=381445 RepID=UPI0003765943|nr:PepSY domain-containing protein [Amycolatopsis nigrescens]
MATSGTDQQSRDPAPQVKAKRPAAGRGSAVRVLARRLHFLAGIVVAPFLVAQCLTGLVYVFSPQIHDSLYASQLYVDSQNGERRPVSEQVSAALTAHPEATARSVITRPEPDRTTRVLLSVPGAEGIGAAAKARTVFVDPYTNYLNGELTTADNRMPANTWLRDLHSNLHLGAPGRLYAELAASWLPLIIVGGLVLWLAQPRRRKRVRTRELLVPSARAKGGWSRLRGVHGPLGLWLALGLLLVGITGLAMSQYAGGRANQEVDPLHLRAPALVAAPVEIPPNAAPIGLDRALAVAEAEGLTGELILTLPQGPGGVFTAAERSAGLPVQRDSIAIHPYTAQVTERIGWGDYSLAAALSTLGTEFHTGTLFGLANQILVTALVLGLLVLIVLGYRMWWVRSPYRARWASLPPPAWRQLPRRTLLLTLPAAAALGWLLPVLGVSLVGFILVDGLLTTINRRRRQKPLT